MDQQNSTNSLQSNSNLILLQGQASEGINQKPELVTSYIQDEIGRLVEMKPNYIL